MNILITGASRGMGLNHAKIFNKSNNKLFLTDISKSAFSVFHNENDEKNFIRIFQHNNIKSGYGDLTVFSESKKIINHALKWFDNDIDIVICNAGGDIPGKSITGYADKAKINDYMISSKEFSEIFNRNFLTTFNTIKSILPQMKKNKKGTIITVGSTNALINSKNEFAYSIAKNSIIKMTKILAKDLKDFNISVNCICPGPTKTSRFMFTSKQRKKEELALLHKKTGLNRAAEMDEISLIVNMLTHKKARFITGQIIAIDGGVSLE